MTRPIESMARIVMALSGLALLLVSTADVLSPRVRYRQSHPEPAGVLDAPPAAVTVRFRGELSPQSTIQVVSTVSILPSGARSYSGGADVVAESGLDPNDPSHRSLRAVLRPGLPQGLYRVDWSTLATRGRAVRTGCYYFGVGMSVPDSITRDLGGPLRERDPYDPETLNPQAGAFVGLLLIGLAILVPWLRPGEERDTV